MPRYENKRRRSSVLFSVHSAWQFIDQKPSQNADEIQDVP